MKAIVEHTHKDLQILKLFRIFGKIKQKRKSCGLVTQLRTCKYVPNAVSEDKDGILSVNYTAVLVAKMEAAEKRIKDLEDRLLRYEN